MAKKTVILFLVVLLVGLSGCRSFYRQHQEFHNYFRAGKVEEAAEVLSRDRRADRRRTRLLHLFNQGVVHHMLGNYQESNRFFEEAYILGEDFLTNYMDEALALLTNPNMTEYRGEDFELLMVHYYKAMNYIHLGNFEAALVECRRLNIRLSAMQDRSNRSGRYQRDAFIHNLMGIIYDASGDYNNAFIAYRNAYNIYTEDYASLFGVKPPPQLKKDLIRAAYRTGFRDQAAHYEELFDMTYNPGMDAGTGDLVFFWQNGLGPVKEEWSINFTIVRGSGGQVNFVNEEMGLSFPFFLGGESSGDLGDLRIVRVAFPKFVERKPVYVGARLRTGNRSADLYLAQDINAIAFKSLEDRMLREMGQALLRLAIRQAAEQRIRKEDERIGALFSILGAVTEQADTRNWQTLPHSIHYSRMALPEGDHSLNLELLLPNGNVARTLNLEANVRSGRTTFKNFHTLDARLPGAR